MEPPAPGRAHRIARGLILLALHLPMAGAAWSLLEDRRAIDASTRPASAEVLVVGPVAQFWGGTIHRTVLGFRTEAGRWLEVTAVPGKHRVGDRLPIRYDPNWLVRIRPDDWAERWAGLAWLGAAWAVLALASAWGLWRGRPRRPARPVSPGTPHVAMAGGHDLSL